MDFVCKLYGNTSDGGVLSTKVYRGRAAEMGLKISLLVSLCHRPRNCNLSNLCGRCKSLAPEIVSWFDSASRNLLRLRRKARCARLSPPADSRAFGARACASRSIFLAPPALIFGSIALALLQSVGRLDFGYWFFFFFFFSHWVIPAPGDETHIMPASAGRKKHCQLGMPALAGSVPLMISPSGEITG